MNNNSTNIELQIRRQYKFWRKSRSSLFIKELTKSCKRNRDTYKILKGTRIKRKISQCVRLLIIDTLLINSTNKDYTIIATKSTIVTTKGLKESILINCLLSKNRINIIKYPLLIKLVEVFLSVETYAKNIAKMSLSEWANTFTKKEKGKQKEYAREHKKKGVLVQPSIPILGLLQTNLRLNDHLILDSRRCPLLNFIKAKDKLKRIKRKLFKRKLSVNHHHSQR
jgi:hypothetical protein